MNLGPDIRDPFELAPELIHLNHGSYGAVPRAVRAEQDRLRALIERDPTGFFQDVYPAEVRRAATAVAARFGGRSEDWVFAENATQAINGVLASFPLSPGDEIVGTSHGYGAILRAMKVWAGRRGVSLVLAEVPHFLQADEQVVAAVAAAFTRRTKLLVVDHITSSTATIFPVREIVRMARAQGVAVLVDGAHVPGHLPLDVTEIGADWYTGNAHKWLFAPRGCGLLWTAPERQAGTRPPVISWGRGAGYAADFDWIGTRDVTPWLAFEAAARFHDSLGGEALMARNRALAGEATEFLIENNGLMACAPAAMRGAMATLSLASSDDSTRAAALRQILARIHGIVIPVSHFGGRLWLRISAQAYNKIDDYQRLGRALSSLLPLP